MMHALAISLLLCLTYGNVTDDLWVSYWEDLDSCFLGQSFCADSSKILPALTKDDCHSKGNKWFRTFDSWGSLKAKSVEKLAEIDKQGLFLVRNAPSDNILETVYCGTNKLSFIMGSKDEMKNIGGIAVPDLLIVAPQEKLLGNQFKMVEYMRTKQSLKNRGQQSLSTMYTSPVVFKFSSALSLALEGTSGDNEFKKLGVTGEGEVIAMADTGIDTRSCFFSDGPEEPRTEVGVIYKYPNRRKVIRYNAFANGKESTTLGHGTHVAGILAGSDPFNRQDDGVASAAKISFFDIGADDDSIVLPRDIRIIFESGKLDGARIHSNSWSSSQNTYSEHSQTVDSYSFDNQDALLVFSAGNDGSPGSVGTPGTSKNSMTVGASYGGSCSNNCENNVAEFSSQGPTADGRIKPDILAPGVGIISAAAGESCSVTVKQGTSMSTPFVAGAATLARQFLKNGFYPAGIPNPFSSIDPRGSLIKAIIINSGVTLTGTYNGSSSEVVPLFVQGFGRMSLGRSMLSEGNNPLGSSVFYDGDMANEGSIFKEEGTKATYELMAVPGSILKVTLCWHDPPASLQSRKALVNDLDLVVIMNSVEEYPNGNNEADRLNNVEQVEIIIPQSMVDTYVTIIVSSFALNEGPQPYSLVISGEFDLQNTHVKYPDGSNSPFFSQQQLTAIDDAILDRAANAAVEESYGTAGFALFGLMGAGLLAYFIHVKLRNKEKLLPTSQVIEWDRPKSKGAEVKIAVAMVPQFIENSNAKLNSISKEEKLKSPSSDKSNLEGKTESRSALKTDKRLPSKSRNESSKQDISKEDKLKLPRSDKSNLEGKAESKSALKTDKKLPSKSRNESSKQDTSKSSTMVKSNFEEGTKSKTFSKTENKLTSSSKSKNSKSKEDASNVTISKSEDKTTISHGRGKSKNKLNIDDII